MTILWGMTLAQLVSASFYLLTAILLGFAASHRQNTNSATRSKPGST